MIKNKRGAEFWPATKFLFWMLFGVILAFTAIAFVIYITSSGEDITKIRANLESYFLVERFLKSENCFVFYDNNIKKTYTGTIELRKFTDEQLNNCINSITQEELAFRITLSSSVQLEELPATIKTRNWNDNRPIEKREQSRRVLILYSNNYYNGDMTIEIQNLK